MLPYNVDFFDHNGLFITNANIDDVSISFDYLSGGSNTFTFLNVNNIENVERGGFLHIFRNTNGFEENYFGFITALEYDTVTNSTLNIEWTDIMNLFDVDWCIDTNIQHSGTALETYIASQMEAIGNNVLKYGANNITLSFETTSATTSWGFNLKSDVEGMHHCIVNFYNTFIIRALKTYNVMIQYEPIITQDGIELKFTIGKLNPNYITIEADLPNVVEKNIIIHETSDDVNRVTIYNEANYSQYFTYYLGEDGNVYRIGQGAQGVQRYPVVYETLSLSTEGSFATDALAEATALFADVSYKDLIELTVIFNDELVTPSTLSIGSTYRVISKGVQYTTVLTGREVEDGLIKLTFGTTRYDLTKILRKE